MRSSKLNSTENGGGTISMGALFGFPLDPLPRKDTPAMIQARQKQPRGSYIAGQEYRRALLLHLSANPDATADSIARAKLCGRKITVTGVKHHLDTLREEGLIVTRRIVVTEKGMKEVRHGRT